jgi:hypothetical protein
VPQEIDKMDEHLITIGCVMAMATEQDSGEITSSVDGDVILTFCFLTESEDQTLIVTSQARELADMGFLPIGIAQIHAHDTGEFLLRGLTGLSASLRLALHHKANDLVRNALGGLAAHQN